MIETLFLSIFGSLINYFINFPFTYSDYEKLFKVSTFSSKKIRELGFKTKYDFQKFMRILTMFVGIYAITFGTLLGTNFSKIKK